MDEDDFEDVDDIDLQELRDLLSEDGEDYEDDEENFVNYLLAWSPNAHEINGNFKSKYENHMGHNQQRYENLTRIIWNLR